jgi:hypothetical protein
LSEKFPAVPTVTETIKSLYRTIDALKQVVELLLGTRGSGQLAAVLRQDLVLKPLQLQVFTTQNLPLARDWKYCIAYVEDGQGGRHIVVSDGLVWKYADGGHV